MYIEVGASAAKTRRRALRRGVQTGNNYTFTLRGEAVADLVQAQGHRRSDAATAAENMRAFMRSRQPVAGVNLKALIDEGRA